MKVGTIVASSDRRTFLQASVLAGGSWLLSATAGATSDPVAPSLSPASKVKVADVRTYKLKDAIFVQVISDTGISGWGEAGPSNPHVLETIIHTALKRHIIGRAIWDAEPIWDEMFFSNEDLGSSRALTSAIAAMDCALWDMKGKATGLPVYKLLGGKYRTRIRAGGSVVMNLTPHEIAREAASLVEQGFTVIKLQVQVRERNTHPRHDPTIVYAQAIRRAIGERIEFYVDLNNGYTAARAIEIGKRLHGELGVNYLEEPVSTLNLRELAQVSDALDMPIIAGRNESTRWQYRDLIDIGHVGILHVEVTTCGGLTEAKKIAALGQACSKPIIPQSTGLTFNTAVGLHFMASISNAGPFIQCVDGHQLCSLLGMIRSPIEFKDGFLMVPQTPGLGLDVDETTLTRALG